MDLDGLLAQDVDGHGTICSLMFVRLPWIRDIYEHELSITQPKWAKTWVVQWTLKETIKFKVENSLLVGWLVGNIIGSSIHDLNQDTKMQVPTNGYWYWFHEENGSNVLIAFMIFLE